MRAGDLAGYSARALSGYRIRTLLMLTAMTIGVASVVLLTALGEGARRYILDEFSSLGTNLLIVLPGRSETTGGAPPLLGAVPRDLTLDDAQALARIPSVRRIAPIVVGSAPVARGPLEREVTILGSTAELYEVRHLSIGQGRFLPPGGASVATAVCVLGYNVKKELFGNRRALGQWIRIDDRRYRVIGVLKQKGQSLGIDIGDVAILPVASAQALFDTSSLFRILVEAGSRETIPHVEKAIREVIRLRHEGEDDITILTQDALLSTFDRIIGALTLTIAGIATISLLVAGILIMNVVLVSVAQRTAEIGLLKALGASGGQITSLFLAEAGILSMLGATAGLLVAAAGSWILARMVPTFPITMPLWSMAASVGIALATGFLFAILPARRAARMDPVLALTRH